MGEPAAKPNIEVRVAADAAMQERVARFRYDVLVEALGGALVHADQQRRTVSDLLDAAAVHIYALADGMLVGAVRVSLGDPLGQTPHLRTAFQLDKFSPFPTASFSLTDRLVVALDRRTGPVAAMLLAAAFKLARRRDCRFDFAHCAPSLVQLYERLGYRRYSDNFMDHDGAYQVPMVLLLEDYGHLGIIRSPFARLASELKQSNETAVWFARTFPVAAARPSEQGMSEDRFWQYLTARLHEYPHQGVPLLAGLSHHEAKRFLTIGTVLTCRGGDRVVRQGDIGREMFVLLAGEAEVRVRAAGKSDTGENTVVARFGRGDIFGEIAYIADTPRSADVVAKGDIEVLVVTQETMRLAMRQMPEISAKVLFNLSSILCHRLHQSNQARMQQHAAE